MVSSALLQETDPETVILPSNVRQWRFVRSKDAFPNGVYSAYDNLGNREFLAGGPAGGSFGSEVTSPDGLTLTAVPTGGVGPFTYAWSVKSAFLNGTNISFAGPTNAQVANINNVPPSFDGMVTVRITDSFGRVTNAEWSTRKDNVL